MQNVTTQNFTTFSIDSNHITITLCNSNDHITITQCESKVFGTMDNFFFDLGRLLNLGEHLLASRSLGSVIAENIRKMNRTGRLLVQTVV